MKWNYRYPQCGYWHSIEWSDREKSLLYVKLTQFYYAPTPAHQPEAYVDTHDWPDELERVVISIKGIMCRSQVAPKYAKQLDVPHPTCGLINKLFLIRYVLSDYCLTETLEFKNRITGVSN